jgi:hypothetical protein
VVDGEIRVLEHVPEAGPRLQALGERGLENPMTRKDRKRVAAGTSNS